MKKSGLIFISSILLVSCHSASKKQKIDETNGPPPKLLAPQVKKIWIPPVIKNGGQEWEEGHYLYRIDRGTAWSR